LTVGPRPQRIYDERLRNAVRAEADRLLRAAEQVRLMDRSRPQALRMRV